MRLRLRHAIGLLALGAVISSSTIAGEAPAPAAGQAAPAQNSATFARRFHERIRFGVAEQPDDVRAAADLLIRQGALRHIIRAWEATKAEQAPGVAGVQAHATRIANDRATAVRLAEGFLRQRRSGEDMKLLRTFGKKGMHGVWFLKYRRGTHSAMDGGQSDPDDTVKVDLRSNTVDFER